MAPNHSPLSARAEVAWLQVLCSEDDVPPCGMGLRFTRASSPVRQFIRGFVAEQQKKKTTSQVAGNNYLFLDHKLPRNKIILNE